MAGRLRFATPSIEIEHRPDGALLLRSRIALAPHPAQALFTPDHPDVIFI